jgi:tetrahydromethanopterin S-methyltransferase subunit G
MTTDVTRGEFDHLKERVDVLEREVDGEKLVTRHILEQTRSNSDDLAAIKTRLDRVERKVEAVEQKVDGVDVKVSGLTRNLPTIVADVMREVLRERDAER